MRANGVSSDACNVTSAGTGTPFGRWSQRLVTPYGSYRVEVNCGVAALEARGAP